MSRLATFPYRLRRRLAREVRARAIGLDVAWDRWLSRRRRRKENPKELFLGASEWAPWRHADDLGFACYTSRKALVEEADRVCRHEFDLLGSGPIHLGEKIDWHWDFKSGYRWDPSIHYSRVRKMPLPPDVDIKVPWELSRCMHFATLGLADRITGDANYYEEFKRQVRHWIAANPVGRGVNWSCPMDVALRAVNWINAAMLFRHRIEDDPDDAFVEEMAEALWMAGTHISCNLEWCGPRSDVTGNHFLSDVTGLLGLGFFFGHYSTGKKWHRFARHWLEREMQRQVNPDGTNYETSTSYHRLVMEIFLWADAVCEAAGMPFSKDFRDRLSRMADFVAAYSAPSGKAAQFGDNDSGRLLTAGIGDPRDHRYLIDGECAPGGKIDRWLLHGGSVPAGNPHDGGFPDGGYWFARQGNLWIGIHGGAVDHGGAHAHCDQLSLVLNAGGRDVIVDPGTGVYTSDVESRNRFRSTASHNTPVVNGWEQNRFGSGRSEIFLMADDTATRIESWKQDIGESRFVGSHHGFARLREGMVCRRSVRLKNDGMLVGDEISGLQAGDRIEWVFHLDPHVDASLVDGGARLGTGEIELKFAWPEDLTAMIQDARHSRAYGVFESARILHLSATVDQDGVGLYCFQISVSTG